MLAISISTNGEAIAPYVFAGIGLMILSVGLAKARKRWKVMNLPTSKIRSMAMGLVELKGSAVETQDMLTSPFGKTPCVYFEVEVERRERSRKDDTYEWNTKYYDRQGRYMYLKDGTGRTLIDAKHAETDLLPAINKESPNKEQLDTLAELGAPTSGRLRITEKRIAPGDKLYVIGTATDNPFVEEASQSTGSDDTMITEGENETFFLISNRDEKGVKQHLLLTSLALILMGALMAAFGLYQLIS